MSDKKSSMERGLFWVGSVCAIVLTILQISELVGNPSPAAIRAAFSLTNSANLAIAPGADARDEEWTPWFPLGFKVKNSGGKSAKKVKLNITIPTNIRLTSTELKHEIRRIITPEGQRNLVTFEIGDIEPKTTKHVDSAILTSFEKTYGMKVPITTKDNKNLVLPIDMLLTYQIEVECAGEDTTPFQQRFYVSIGSRDSFKKNKIGHWEVEGNKLSFVDAN